jgi:hypothetical protein
LWRGDTAAAAQVHFAPLAQAAAQVAAGPAVWSSIDAELDALDELWEADLRGYAAAYMDVVRQAAAELGITVPVEVEVEVVDDKRGEADWDSLTEQLHDIARERTPLPTNGIAPATTQAAGRPASSTARPAVPTPPRFARHRLTTR